MKTLAVFRKPHQSSYHLNLDGPFLEIIALVMNEIKNGSILESIHSINHETRHVVEITGQVRKLVYRDKYAGRH